VRSGAARARLRAVFPRPRAHPTSESSTTPEAQRSASRGILPRAWEKREAASRGWPPPSGASRRFKSGPYEAAGTFSEPGIPGAPWRRKPLTEGWESLLTATPRRGPVLPALGA